MLIMLASFLPIFFLGEREGRLFNPLAYSKTFAMAGSTLLTLFVLPVIIIWVFKGETGATEAYPESAFVRAYRAALNTTIESTVLRKPQSSWRKDMTKEKLVAVSASTAIFIVRSLPLAGRAR